jgi:hypothetical protein
MRKNFWERGVAPITNAEVKEHLELPLTEVKAQDRQERIIKALRFAISGRSARRKTTRPFEHNDYLFLDAPPGAEVNHT